MVFSTSYALVKWPSDSTIEQGNTVAKKTSPAAQTELPDSGSFNFEVDNSLLIQLGEQLVSKSSVAVGELIKNAYDADAHDVILRFKNVTKPGGQIDILDSGSGITLKKLQSTWMRIATTEKNDNPCSPQYGRPRAGAKGIGRFASHRLARHLVLQTTARVDSKKPRLGIEQSTISFDWASFQPGKDLSLKPVRYERKQMPEGTPTGTLLQLQGVRDAWTESDVADLRKDVLQLISPFARKSKKRRGAPDKDPGFDILFDFDDESLQDASGTLSDDFLESAYGILEGTINSTGEARYSVTFRDQRKSSASFQNTFKGPNTELGQFKFKIYFFVYRSDFFKGLDFNARAAKKLGQEQAGVHVNYDGFRVPPYGDAGDDWLNLDADRSRRLGVTPEWLKGASKGIADPMLLLPGTNGLFGNVQLSRENNPQIIQLANREGFHRNTEFKALRQFVRSGIDWLTVSYARHSSKRRTEARKERERPSVALEKVQEVIKHTPGIEDQQRQEALQAINLAIGSVAEVEADHIGELQMLRVLASTGTMIHVFGHQLVGLLEGLRRGQRQVSQFKTYLPKEEQKKYSKTLSESKVWLEHAEKMANLVGLLMGTKSRSRKRRLVIKPLATEVINSFSGYADDHNISVNIEVPSTLRAPPMFECELNAILVNLLTNAFKAVLSTVERDILIQAKKSSDDVIVSVSDTGKGADLAKAESYFQPFSGDSQPDPVLGAGTGLGLKIVRDFADVYAGTIKFVEPLEGYATTIQLTIPENRLA